MKPISYLLKITAALFLLIGSFKTSLAQKDSAQIHGQIVDFKTQTPLSFVTMVLETPNQIPVANTTSDDTGKFLFKNLAKGYYTISFSAFGYQRYILDSIDLADNESKIILINMVRLKPVIRHWPNPCTEKLTIQDDNTITSFSSKQLLIFR